jgi:hypothetical protein
MGQVLENMIEGTTKKDVCHFAIVLKVLFQKWVPLKGAKFTGEEERSITTLKGQKKKREFEGEVH